MASALDLWAPLAQRGHARAQSNMGAAFLEGRGVERDLAKAVDWLRRAAEQGDAGGQRNLALCYYEGWGVPQDQAAGGALVREGRRQGDADAQDMLSWMKLVGGGCPQDYLAARAWAEKAAAQGRAGAMARLGDIHHNALGVEARSGTGGRVVGNAPRSSATPRRRRCWAPPISPARAWRATRRRRCTGWSAPKRGGAGELAAGVPQAGPRRRSRGAAP